MALVNHHKTKKVLVDTTHDQACMGSRLRSREIEQLQDIIIRAHYLSMELRDICATSQVGPRDMSLAAGHMLKSWARAFAEDLERSVNPPNSP